MQNKINTYTFSKTTMSLFFLAQLIVFVIAFVLGKGVLLFAAGIALVGLAAIAMWPATGTLLCIGMLYGYIATYFAQGAFKFVIVAVLGLTLLHYLYQRENLPSHAQLNIAYLFVFIALISLLGAADFGSGVDAALEMIKAIILLFLVVATFTEMRWLVAAAWVIVFTASLGAMIGFYEAFQDPAGFLVRLGSQIVDTNNFALLLVTAVPFAYFLIRTSQGMVLKLLAFLPGLLCLAAIPPTLSRGAILSLASVLAFILWKERRRKAVQVMVAVSSALVLLLFLIYIGEFLDAVSERLTSVDESMIQRYRLLMGSLGMMADHPGLGVGLGNYLNFSTRYSGIALPLFAHNMYLHVGAETGILNMLLFIGLIINSFRILSNAETRSRNKGNMKHALIAQAIAFSLLGFCVGGMFLSQHFNKVLWILIGFAIAVDRVTSETTENAA